MECSRKIAVCRYRKADNIEINLNEKWRKGRGSDGINGGHQGNIRGLLRHWQAKPNVYAAATGVLTKAWCSINRHMKTT